MKELIILGNSLIYFILFSLLSERKSLFWLGRQRRYLILVIIILVVAEFIISPLINQLHNQTLAMLIEGNLVGLALGCVGFRKTSSDFN